jgi:hypothetical protein
VSAMCKTAFFSIGTSSEFREILAEFSLMLDRIGFEGKDFLISILTVITLGGSAGGKIT